MKEKIQLLSKGIFEYNNPDIQVSEQVIVIDAAYGDRYSGYFEISSRNQIPIRAMVFSSNKWMHCMTSSFVGVSGQIHFVFDTEALEIGERSEGRFSIVSNGGEIEIPYHVHVHAPYLETSMGPINELEQFAALARENWNEALGIFSSKAFEKVFLGLKKNKGIYDSLIKSTQPGLALEEFLCTVRRKKPVEIFVAQDLVEYEDLDKETSGKLLIEKNNWGHVHIDVTTEGSFLKVFKKDITDDDFLGSYYQLEYTLTPDRSAQSDGKIILETYAQRIIVPVHVTGFSADQDKESERKSLEDSWKELYRLFVRYEMNKISRDSWLSQTRDAIDGCLNNSDDVVYHIAEAHFHFLSGDAKSASAILENINGRELRYSSAVLYSYYLYVTAICRREENYTQFVTDTIRFYVEGQYKDRWELIWFLIKLEGAEDMKGSRIFKMVRDQFDSYRPGPLLYIEASRIVNNNPNVVREMGSFETSLYMWGVRHDIWNREAVYQFSEQILKMRTYHQGCLFASMSLCDIYETKNLLAAVLHMLVLGGRKEKRFNKWYLLGIESSIRMQDLYEYYMDTLDFEHTETLPTAVLIYFQYDNSLKMKQKAFLFRYVVEHRNDYPKLFTVYDGIIKSFALQQLQQGQINENLAEIYKYYLTKEVLTAHNVKALPKIIFKQRVCLDAKQEHIAQVIVDYSEIEDELCYPVIDGEAYVDIFMDDYRIVFVDENGGRYMSSVAYHLEKLIDSNRYIRECYEQCRDNRMVILNRSERVLKYQMMDDASVEVYKNVLRLENVSRHFQKTILKNLIDYYYDSYEGETLEKYLLQLDIRLLGHAERSHIIEYFIQRGLYTKAYQAIMTYGYEGIQDKRIMRLCSRIIRENAYEEDSLLTELAYHAFSNGKYDEVVLKYLVSYYYGTTRQLYEIWKAAKNFEVPARKLEERLISEVLFTENLLNEGCEVFESYYDDFQSGLLVRAFLAFYAYEFLMERQDVKKNIFRIMAIEIDQLENLRDLCSLSLLKYYAGQSRNESEYAGWIEKEVGGFIDKGIVLSFFRKFSGMKGVPSELIDLTYVEYHASPDTVVTIHYSENQPEAVETSRPMKNVFGGIFTATFRLYSGQKLNCYITEGQGDRTKKMKTMVLTPDIRRGDRLLTGMDHVNRMLDYIDFHDDLALDEEIAAYDRIDAVTDLLFDLK